MNTNDRGNTAFYMRGPVSVEFLRPAGQFDALTVTILDRKGTRQSFSITRADLLFMLCAIDLLELDDVK